MATLHSPPLPYAGLMIVPACQVCPFYLSRDPGILAQADIVLVPYSYLVDPASRRALQVDWQNAVLIFDEAHNLVQTTPPLPCTDAPRYHPPPPHPSATLPARAQEDWCTAAMSFDLTAATVANCVQEVDLCLSRLREREQMGKPPAATTHGDGGDSDPAANVSTQVRQRDGVRWGTGAAEQQSIRVAPRHLHPRC